MLTLMGVAGCVEESRTYSQELEAEVLEYLNDSYSVDFVVGRIVPASNAFTGLTYDVVTVHAADDPDYQFEVHRRASESGEHVFTDGFALALAEQQIESEVQPAWSGWNDARVAVRFKTATGVVEGYQPTGGLDMAQLGDAVGAEGMVLVWVFAEADSSNNLESDAADVASRMTKTLTDASSMGARWGIAVYYLSEQSLRELNPRDFASMDYLDVGRLSGAQASVIIESATLGGGSTVTESDVVKVLGK